jgi:hypothetical protein
MDVLCRKLNPPPTWGASIKPLNKKIMETLVFIILSLAGCWWLSKVPQIWRETIEDLKDCENFK